MPTHSRSLPLAQRSPSENLGKESGPSIVRDFPLLCHVNNRGPWTVVHGAGGGNFCCRAHLGSDLRVGLAPLRMCRLVLRLLPSIPIPVDCSGRALGLSPTRRPPVTPHDHHPDVVRMVFHTLSDGCGWSIERAHDEGNHVQDSGTEGDRVPWVAPGAATPKLREVASARSEVGWRPVSAEGQWSLSQRSQPHRHGHHVG